MHCASDKALEKKIESKAVREIVQTSANVLAWMWNYFCLGRVMHEKESYSEQISELML